VFEERVLVGIFKLKRKEETAGRRELFILELRNS
jgi:hypothetical protein